MQTCCPSAKEVEDPDPVKGGAGTTKETSNDKEVVNGFTYPCAGNSNLITLPGVKTKPFLGLLLNY